MGGAANVTSAHASDPDVTPLRILCLNYEYPPVGGGGGRIAHRINAGLVARGHAVRVQTAGMRHLAANETVDGVEIFRAESFRKKEDTCTVPEMAMYLVTSLRPALHHVRSWRPDVIHVHFAVPTGALALAVHWLTGMPYVLTAHLGDVPGGVPEQTAGLFRLVQPFTRPIWNSACAVTAVSTFVADLAAAAYGLRPEVILNGIPLRPAPQIKVNNPPRILLVGRLSVQKNPLLAIETFARLTDLAWQLDVIGDGPLRPEMERAAHSAGIGNRVNFRGWLGGDAVATEMAGADVLLMASLAEGLPMAAIEALGHGLAVVSTPIPGVRDVVDDGENGVIGSFDADEMAAAFRPVLSDATVRQRLREGAVRTAVRFDLDRVVDQYESTLAGCRRAPGSSAR